MASSGQYLGPVADGNRVYMNWQVKSQSQSGNYTDVNWQIGWNFFSSPSCRGLRSGDGKINGTVVYHHYGSGDNIHTFKSGHNHPWLQTGSGTFRIYHDANGYATIQVFAGMTGWQNQRSEGTSGTWDLPRIPKPPLAPGTPSTSLVAPTGPDSTKVNVSWSAPDNRGSPITGYTLQIATNSNFTQNVYSFAISGTSATVINLGYNTTWYFRVRATNGVGTGPYSSAASRTTGANVPDAPIIGNVTNVTPVTADVSWSPPPSDNGSTVTGYDVQLATNAGFTGATTTTVGTTASPYTLTNLAPSTTYYVRVRAKNAVGDSAWSATRSFLTLPSVHVAQDGQWVNAIAYMVVNGQWVPVQVKVEQSGAWA